MNDKSVALLQEPGLPGLRPDLDALELARSFAVYEEGGVMVANRKPSPVDRQILSKRSAAIGSVLAPIAESSVEWKKAKQAIAMLFVGRPSARNLDPETITDEYLAILKDLPLFAIVKVIEDAVKGRLRGHNDELLDPKWIADATTIHVAASKHVAALREEKWKMDKVILVKRIAPPPVSKEVAETMAKKLSGLAETMRAPFQAEADERAARRANAAGAGSGRLVEAEWLREGYEPLYGRDGTLSSPALYKRMGNWPPPGAKRS